MGSFQPIFGCSKRINVELKCKKCAWVAFSAPLSTCLQNLLVHHSPEWTNLVKHKFDFRIYIPFHTLKPSPTAHLGFCLLSFWFLPMLRQNGNLTFESLKKLCSSPIIRSSPHQLTQPTHRCVWIILILMFDHNFPTKITIIGRWIPRFSSTKPAHSVLSFLHHDSTIFRYLSLQLTLVMTTTGGFSYANINDLGAIGALGTSMRTFH